MLPEPNEGLARLENTLLIDDQSNYIIYTQALNLLYVPPFKHYHLNDLNDPTRDDRAETKTDPNRLFFVAGVIQELLTKVTETLSIRDYIKTHQFKPKEDNPTWLKLNFQFSESLALFDTGLNALQETSPGLTLLTPDRFRKIIQPPLSQAECEIVH
ncbi:MAG: hypothetical protein KDK62_06265 [Chlamydiia bacterium]|nr:hypothetical protein [Chlamydiia bacterium]